MPVCCGFHGSLYLVFSVGITEIVLVYVILCSHIGGYQCFVGTCFIPVEGLCPNLTLK